MEALLQGQVQCTSNSSVTSSPNSQVYSSRSEPYRYYQMPRSESPDSPVDTADMPRLARQSLAKRLQRNWMTKHPREKASVAKGLQLDDSLTNLSWLLSLNSVPTPPTSPEPLTSDDGSGDDSAGVDPNSVLHLTDKITIKKEPGLYTSPSSPSSPISGPMFSSTSGFYSSGSTVGNTTHVTFTPCTPPAEVDYRTNPKVKPPFSYATLIRMAISESAEGKLTLAEIYSWITDNFIYFRHADTSWQNSIRHNLSLNKSFQKLPRRKDEPGKGGFWQISPDFNDATTNSIYKKRSVYSRDEIVTLPSAKRVRCEQDEAVTAISDSDFYTSEELSGVMGLSGGDVSWGAIFNQDIEVAGIRIKTEKLIDGEDDTSAASPITSFSPPPSSNNSDAGLEEFLQSDLSSDMDNPVDLTSGQPLDLSINGISLHPSGWWSEQSGDSLNESRQSGLHTPPRCPSPVHGGGQTDLIAHAWAESQAELLDQALTSFDLEINSMFDVLGES